MKAYLAPELELVKYQVADVLTTSETPGDTLEDVDEIIDEE